MEKYTIPLIPTSQQILEDISDSEIVQVTNFPDQLHEGEEQLQKAYSAYRNIKHLEDDLIKQGDLKTKLDELQMKLVENIANMKKQTILESHPKHKVQRN